jgi:hypothetical protein
MSNMILSASCGPRPASTRLVGALLSAWMWAVFVAALASAGLMPKIELADKSFALDAVLIVKDAQSVVSYNTQELHSAWQRRSTLHYKASSSYVERRPIDRIAQTGTFYAEANRNEVFLVDASAGTCQAKEREFVNRVLHLDLPDDRPTDRSVAANNDNSSAAQAEHLIGAARLLTYLNSIRDKFILVSNMGKIKFKTIDKALGETKIIVVYSNVAGENLAHGIPRTVVITKPDKSVMFCDFTRYVPIADDRRPHFFWPAKGTAGRTEHFHRADQTVEFELFAWDRALGCSKETVRAKPKDEPSLAGRLGERRLSFSARLNFAKLGEPMELMVGYEPALSSLRVNRISAARSTELLADYRNDRSFHLLKRRARSGVDDVVFDRILATKDESSCVVSSLSAAAGLISNARRDAPPLGHLLLGATRLTYLGLARVRGVEARVYESFDCEWPFWYEQPTVYKDESPRASVTAVPGGGGGLYRRTISGPTRGPKTNLDLVLNSVFYFSVTPEDRDPILDASLLLIEVFKLSKEHTSSVLDVAPIHIYDFSWQLNALAPDGRRWEDFFALGDECAASPALVQKRPMSVAGVDTQYARISMLLANEEPGQETAWLREPARRHLALARSAQEHFLPSNMVYNLESRLSAPEVKAQSGPALESMSVTMEVAERVRDIVRMVYLGSARTKLTQLLVEKLQLVMVFSMQSCSILVAHKRRDSLFAFDAIHSRCFMLRDEEWLAREGLKSVMDALFAIQEDGPLEVYRVEHQANVKLTAADYFSNLEQHRDRLMKIDHILLTDPVSLVEPRVDSSLNNNNNMSGKRTGATRRQYLEIVKTSLKIKQFELDYLNDRTPFDNPNGDQAQMVDLNKFPGIGLVPEDRQNKLLPATTREPDELAAGNLTRLELPALGDMTFERCQTACLADLDCRSYSTCLRDGSIECILSAVSFKELYVARQVTLLLQKRTSKFSERFSIGLVEEDDRDEAGGEQRPGQGGAGRADVQEPDDDERFIRVRKQSTCELHNKLYGDLFKPKQKISINLAGRVFRPVSSVEQCASRCFQWTVDKLRRNAAAAGEKSDEPNEQLAAPNRSLPTRTKGAVCDSFFYVDHVDVVALGRQLHDNMAERELDYLLGKQKTGGYCVFSMALDSELNDTEPDSVKITNDAKLAELDGQFLVREYRFEHKSLFERHFGWSLVESSMSAEERSAYSKLTSSAWYPADELKTASQALSSFLARGENSGYWLPMLELDDCARVCLDGDYRIWPACRSFDYFEIASPATPFKVHYCAFNTMTLKQAVDRERFDLIRKGEAQERFLNDAANTLRVWHFELKHALVADQPYRGIGIGLGRGREEPSIDQSRPHLHLSSFALFCIVSLSLAIGTMSGIKVAVVLVESKDDDKEGLVDVALQQRAHSTS